MSQIILVASGKGGSGKSSFVTGVSRALTSLGKKVLAVDCDIGLRSLDIMFDVTEKVVFDWGDLLMERCTAEQAIIKGEIDLLALSENPDAVQLGKTKVNESHVGVASVDADESVLAVECFVNVAKAGVSQALAQRLALNGILVSDQNLDGMILHDNKPPKVMLCTTIYYHILENITSNFQ